MLSLMLAQSVGEYGATSGAGVLGRIGEFISSTGQWIADSFEQNTGLWVGAAVVLLVVFFLFRRR